MLVYAMDYWIYGLEKVMLDLGEIRDKIDGIDRQLVNDVLAQFFAQLRQLFHAQSAQIFRISYAAEKPQFAFVHLLFNNVSCKQVCKLTQKFSYLE